MKIDMQQVTHQMRFYISEIKSLQDKNKELSDTLKLDRERYRGIITELEVELDKFVDKSKKK
tara:strand:+ start:511 stop:696 length:186 start_codon:yes stop_codon:yes gene_type:complete